MALEGDLEDLDIRDILQILSLSKKSGVLTLKNRRDDEGCICFTQGQVIRASSTVFAQGLGQLLCRNDLVTQTQVDEALKYQQSLPDHKPLGKIIVDLYQVSEQAIERIVAQQIEKIVFNFFSWKEGFFSFRLEQIQTFGSALLNPLDFMLEKGLSPQRLLIKGEKIIRQGAKSISEDMIDKELKALKNRQQQQGIHLLRGMLAELEHPEFGGGIILLILRYASEIMGRAIIFDVRGQQLVGLGQFGLEGLNASADEVVRKMRLDIDSDSLFSHVLKEKVAQRGALKNSQAENYLRSFLSEVPDEVFLAPLISDGNVVALLYGDNYLQGQTDQSIDTFEVFLSQAGLAMEQALQEDRVI
jgi:hypothetical protein